MTKKKTIVIVILILFLCLFGLLIFDGKNNADRINDNVSSETEQEKVLKDPGTYFYEDISVEDIDNILNKIDKEYVYIEEGSVISEDEIDDNVELTEVYFDAKKEFTSDSFTLETENEIKPYVIKFKNDSNDPIFYYVNIAKLKGDTIGYNIAFAEDNGYIMEDIDDQTNYLYLYDYLEDLKNIKEEQKETMNFFKRIYINRTLEEFAGMRYRVLVKPGTTRYAMLYLYRSEDSKNDVSFEIDITKTYSTKDALPRYFSVCLEEDAENEKGCKIKKGQKTIHNYVIKDYVDSEETVPVLANIKDVYYCGEGITCTLDKNNNNLELIFSEDFEMKANLIDMVSVVTDDGCVIPIDVGYVANEK